MSRIKKTVLTCIGIAMALIAILMVWHSLLRPTKILVVNPLPAQKAEIILNNDSRLYGVKIKPATVHEDGIIFAEIAGFFHCRACGMKYTNGQNTVTYFGAVFYSIK